MGQVLPGTSLLNGKLMFTILNLHKADCNFVNDMDDTRRTRCQCMTPLLKFPKKPNLCSQIVSQSYRITLPTPSTLQEMPVGMCPPSWVYLKLPTRGTRDTTSIMEKVGCIQALITISGSRGLGPCRPGKSHEAREDNAGHLITRKTHDLANSSRN